MTGSDTSVVLYQDSSVVDDAHWERLVALDPVFRDQGLEAWLGKAGFKWISLSVDARQIEEETSPERRVLAAGVQVDGQGIEVLWPACVTTDDPGEIVVRDDSRQYQPDLTNPSVLYTNVMANGTVTLWVDCSNWEQLFPPR